MNMIFFAYTSSFLGCSTPEERTQEMLKELTKQQTSCSVLQEGKRVPSDIQNGACSHRESMYLTLHRECANGVLVHSNPLGWWIKDGIFHEGEPPKDILIDCRWM